MSFITKSITRKTVTILFAMSLIPIIIISFIGYQISEQLRDEFIKELQIQFKVKDSALQSSLEQRIFEMDVLSHNILFQELLSDLPEITILDIESELESRYLDYAERTLYVDTILEIKAIGLDGVTKFSLYDTDLGSELTPESINEISDIQVKFDHDERLGRIVKATAPIMDPGHSTIGILLFVTDMRNFDRVLLDRIGLKETGEAYLVNLEKIMASESRFIENAAYNQVVDTYGVRQCLENNDQVLGEIYNDYRGEPIIGYSKCMPENGVVLLVEADVKELASSLDKIQFQFLTLLPFMVIGFFFISLMTSKKLVAPVKKLRTQVRKIAEGDYDASVTLKREDEFGELAKMTNQLAAELKQSTKQKQEFLAMITHELKTPLTPIQGFCEMLKDPDMGELNEDQKEAVDEIYNNSEELLHLIGNVLTAQKIEINQLKFNIQEIGVDEFIEGRYRSLLPLMVEKGIKFVNSTEKGLVANGDNKKLNEVFANLVENSIDFVPDKNGRIEIGAKSRNKDVLFYVKDNGKGIPKDKIKNMFKKFYQIDSSYTRKHGGSGLGLSICKGYIEGLGGKMWVESEPNVETTFYFTLARVQQKTSFEEYEKSYVSRHHAKKGKKITELKEKRN